MTNEELSKSIERELNFFLEFYLAFDKPRARNLSELVTLIGHCLRHQSDLRHVELCQRLTAVIESHPEVYSLEDELVWLTGNLEQEEVALTMAASAAWPTDAYRQSEREFRKVCKEGLSEHVAFANEYLDKLGAPDSSRSERRHYADSSVHLLKLLTHPQFANKYGLRDQAAAFAIIEAGDTMFKLHFAESQRLAGL